MDEDAAPVATSTTLLRCICVSNFGNNSVKHSGTVKFLFFLLFFKSDLLKLSQVHQQVRVRLSFGLSEQYWIKSISTLRQYSVRLIVTDHTDIFDAVSPY